MKVGVFVFGPPELQTLFLGTTRISLSEQYLMELPSIVLCFEKPCSRSTVYEYGSNFTIHYEISDENYIHQGTLWLNEGENLVKEDSAWDKMPSLPKNNVIALVVKYEWYSCIFISPFETADLFSFLHCHVSLKLFIKAKILKLPT